MGTQKEDFVQLTERIGRKTGGLSFSPFTAHKRGQAEPQAYLMVRGKVTASKAPDMLDLMRDILLTARLDDKDRFKQVCLPCCHCHLLSNALCLACMVPCLCLPCFHCTLLPLYPAQFAILLAL